jgi:hypothetical protein
MMDFQVLVRGVPVGEVSLTPSDPGEWLGVLRPAAAYDALVRPALGAPAENAAHLPPELEVRAWYPVLGDVELRDARGTPSSLHAWRGTEARAHVGATTFVFASDRTADAGVVAAPRVSPNRESEHR